MRNGEREGEREGGGEGGRDILPFKIFIWNVKIFQ